MILQALEYEFFRNALIAGLLASVACGIIGAFVVSKQMSSISGGISHAAIGGIGLAHFLEFSPNIGALIFTVISALVIGLVYLKQRESLDSLVAIVWAVGMSLGIVFLSLKPGQVPNLHSYLFGNILLISKDYLIINLLFDVLLVGVVVRLFKELQAVAFDEEYSKIIGVNVNVIFLLLILLTSLTVVVLIKVVGVVLMIALLTLPAVIARQWAGSLKSMIGLSILIVGFSTVFGLFSSYLLSSSSPQLDVPTGPLIILLITVLYIFSSLIKAIKN
jgi:zinc transport system permease protein